MIPEIAFDVYFSYFVTQHAFLPTPLCCAADVLGG